MCCGLRRGTHRNQTTDKKFIVMILLGSLLLEERQLLLEVSGWALFKIKDVKIGVLERSFDTE